MGRFSPGNLIEYFSDINGPKPIIRVQEEIDGQYILIGPDSRKFIRNVGTIDATFELWLGFTDEELLG